MAAEPLLTSAAAWARAGRLILPVVGAGLCHVAVLKMRWLDQLVWPIDGGARWRGQQLLGPNKTWRGLVMMTVLTSIFTRIEVALVSSFRGRPPVSTGLYRTNPWIAGGTVGLAYCLAELPNSLVKRLLGVSPGALGLRAPRLQYAVDQLDSVIGCMLALRLVYRPRRGELAAVFVLGALIHVGVDALMHGLGLKGRGR